ncbi:hypothetical protein ABZ470_00875 [Streptosporangium sp. NPDC020072]|uniref:hypothetical protein n=1 Tax=Streptosporangium sp. NPDC020072 TaxID=3154788 RepID=UPI00342BDB4A
MRTTHTGRAAGTATGPVAGTVTGATVGANVGATVGANVGATARATLRAAAGTLARGLASARGERAIFADGATFHATLRPLDHPMFGVPALDGPGDHPALVRLSRAGLLPAPLPDVLGLAVRLPGAGGAGGDLDLLLCSALWPGLLPLPRRRFVPGVYSTILAYDRAGEPLRFLAVGHGPAAGVPAVPALLGEAVADGPLEFTLGVDGADRRPLVRLSVHTPLPDQAGDPPGFDPVLNSHPALRPSERLQATRLAAYAGSRRGRAVR